MQLPIFVKPGHRPRRGAEKNHQTVIAAFTAFVALAAASPAFAQETGSEAGKAKTPDQKANPLGGAGLKVDAGYRYASTGKRDTTYYKIDFQGTTLADRGTAFTDAERYASFKSVRNDEPALKLNLERGAANVEGPFANFLQRTQFPGVRSLRGVVQGYGSFDGSSAPGFVLGVETLPLSASLPAVPNFLTLGVQFGTNQVATSTGTERKTQQSDIGVLAYRQFFAYAPLNRYSDLRENARAIANGLPDDKTTLVPEFYVKVIQGDTTWFDSIEPAFDTGTETGKKAKASFERLTEDQKKEITRDLRVSIPFLASDLKGMPLETANALREQLVGTSPTETVLARQFDTLATIPPAIANWRTDAADTRRMLNRFLVSGGIVLNSDDRTEAQTKAFVRDDLKVTEPARLLTSVDSVIALAYKQTKASDKQALLTVANRLILQSLFPEVANYGVQVAGLRPTLLRLYELKDRSASVLLVENTGQYYFAGDDGNRASSRLNHLFSATATIYRNPGAEKRNYLRLRYESGRNRAAPEIYLNQAIAAVGIEF